MNALDQVTYMLTRFIKSFKYLLALLKIVVLFIIFFNAKNIIHFVDLLNLSFYVRKYDLMPIISGLISVLITVIAMKYIDNLNQKRIEYKMLIEEKTKIFKKYVELLEKLDDFFIQISYICDEKCRILVAGEPLSFLEELQKCTEKLFLLYKDMEKYYGFMEMDIYCEWLYRFKCIDAGVNIAIEKIKNDELEIIYSNDKTCFSCPHIDEIITSEWIETFDKLQQKISLEVIKQNKKYKSI